MMMEWVHVIHHSRGSRHHVRGWDMPSMDGNCGEITVDERCNALDRWVMVSKSMHSTLHGKLSIYLHVYRY